MVLGIKEAILKGRNLVPIEKRNKTLVYLFILIATSLDNLNVSGTLTSIFSVSESFDASTTTISWVFSSYALTLGSFIIIAGKLADVLGPHNVFLVGLFFTSLFALIAAVIVKDVIALIVFRAFQGIFAASLIPSAFALTGNYFTGEALLRAVTGMILSLTSIFGVGVILGGAFSETAIGYKGLYYFTFALGFALFIALFFLIIPINETEGHKNLKVKNLDFGGSIGLIIGLLLVILGLTEGGETWHKPVAYVPLIVGILVVFGVVAFEMWYIQSFKDKIDAQIEAQTAQKTHLSEEEGKKKEVETSNCSVETKSEIPGTKDWRYNLQLLFPREVIKIPNFFQYFFATFLIYINYIAIMSTLIQYNQYVRLQSPILAAVKVLPMSLGLTFGAAIYRERIAQRIGTKKVIISSPIIVLTMSVWLSRLDFRVRYSYWKYECFSQFLLGYGTNLYFQVYWNDIIVRTPLHLQGVVSGILQTTGQIGICFGNTIIATLMGNLTYSKDFDHRKSLHDKFKKNFYLAFGASGCFFIVLLLTKSNKTMTQKHDEEASPQEESAQDKSQEKAETGS